MKKPSVVCILVIALSSAIGASKLKTRNAEVEYYDRNNRLKSGRFEYYVQRSKLHYGSRVGLELFKVRPGF